MVKKRRRSPLQVLKDRAAEIDALERERAVYQKMADGGNAAALLTVARFTLLIAQIIRELRYRRKKKSA